MESLEADIAETLSLLETIFLPSFFDVGRKDYGGEVLG
jgi:hypothetical protein